MDLGHDDDLGDVNLDGVPLVTANWRAWQVPPEAAAFESVFEWWEHLHLRELKLPPRAAAYVKELVDICATDGSVKPMSPSGRIGRAQLLTELLMETGLSFEQVQEVTGIPANRLFTPQMLTAWQKIVAGASASEVHADHPGITLTILRRLVRIRDGEPNDRDLPREWRTEAFALLDQGLSHSKAAAVLSERHGVTIGKHTVYSWVRRRKAVA